MIEARGLTKRYGATVAVDDLTFTVPPGRVTGFLGPNGSGKSTTMRLLLQLDRPNAGTATFSGQPYRSIAHPATEVGALLDAAYAHPSRSARNHLWAVAAASGLRRRRVEEVLAMVGLTEVARRPVAGFSLGMRQRLGLATALLGDPHTLILDEPANGLDPEGIQWIRQLLTYLAGQGRCVFVSSHLLSEMALMADHLVVIGQGRLIADSSVTDFVARYARTWVRVRSPRMAALGPALQREGASVTYDGPDSADVFGATAPAVGDLAARLGIPLHELAPQSSSLEEAFLEGTKAAQQFRAGSPAAAGARDLPAPGTPGSPRARNAIRSEWIKLRTARSNLVLLLLSAVVPVAFTILVTATVRSSDVEVKDRFSLVLAGATIGYLLIAVLGVLIIGQEFRHTTIRVTFTAEPRRTRVMVAKALVVVATGLVVGVIATVFSYAIGNAIMTSRGLDVTLAGSTQARAIAGSVLLYALYGLVGLGVGSIIRATAGAITLVVVWPVIVESIIKGFLPKIGKWLPFNAGSQLTSTDTTINSSEALSPRGGGLVFLIFALVLLAVGTALVSRRDA